MIKKYSLIAWCFALCTTLAAKKNNPTQLLLLDTSNRESRLYKEFIDDATDAGFEITLKSFDQCADEADLYASCKDYSAIFFIFGIEFLAGIQNQSPLAKKLLETFSRFAQEPHKLVGLIFPSFNNISHQENLVAQLAPLFRPIIMSPDKNLADKDQRTLDIFLAIANHFLLRPLTSRPCNYHTSLQSPRPGIAFLTPEIEQLIHHQSSTITLLPKITSDDTDKYATIIAKLVPFGFHWVNPVHNNHIFVSSSTALSFSSIKEDFHICPVNASLKKEMISQRKSMMMQLHDLISSASLPRYKKSKKSSFKKKHSRQPKRSQLKDRTAWMELISFQLPLATEPALLATELRKRATKQDQLIRYIFQAKLNNLWISINPNILYSPIARERHREKQILDAISLFTEKLQAYATKHRAKLPLISIGFEITNNIYSPNLPESSAEDLYGGTYPDLPAPLSSSFWHNEIIQSLQKFVPMWQSIAHGIPLSGVVIDLEMYCRKKSGTFLETMGIDPETFMKFNNSSDPKKSIHERTKNLMDNHNCKSYFVFLEHEAEEVGMQLYNAVNTIIPGATLSCYLPNILVDWFYKGLLKGIGQQAPLHLYTFNTEINEHRDWFSDNNIHVTHSSVLLLSKIKSHHDFKWIKNIMKHHDGIWLNRFSRLIEPYDAKSWIAAEQTPLHEEEKESFMQAVGTP